MNIKKLLFIFLLIPTASNYSMELTKPILNSMANSETAKMFALTAGVSVALSCAEVPLRFGYYEEDQRKELVSQLKSGKFIAKKILADGILCGGLITLCARLGSKWPQYTNEEFIKQGKILMALVTIPSFLICGISYACNPFGNALDPIKRRWEHRWRQSLNKERRAFSTGLTHLIYFVCYNLGAVGFPLYILFNRYRAR